MRLPVNAANARIAFCIPSNRYRVAGSLNSGQPGPVSMAAAAASAVNGKIASTAVAPKLSASTIDPRVVKADYAVRGEIVRRASILEEELQKGKQLPFDKIVWCNIGNPQILGQKPITYFRQVLSLCEYPPVRGFEHRQKYLVRRAACSLRQAPTAVAMAVLTFQLDSVLPMSITITSPGLVVGPTDEQQASLH